jgi:excisionase family DNA binding protein
MSRDAMQRPELMTVGEVAEEWRQSREAVYRKVRAGRIPSVRLGDERADIRIPRAELERIYEMSTSGGGSFAGSEPTMGRGSSVDDPVERDGTSPPAKKTPKTVPPVWTKKIPLSKK